MGEGECEVAEAPKKGRHRKKHLYNSILQQMEFYFSDSNLSKDRFLSQIISKDSYVDISVFLKFNKIRKLNCTEEDISKSVSKSDLIEISEDKKKVRRKKPLKVKENEDDCTIYVENIKADANHDWLSQVFSEFGTVVYVSIPKYKQNKGNKGFAFVEFDTEKEAFNALSFFESIGCKMPSETNPEELRSIVTFEEKTKEADNTSELSATENPKKRKFSGEDNDIEKKIKISEHEDSESENNKNTVEVQNISQVENKKKKRSKKDKKRNYIKDLGLQILSKKEWKKMRNRYLDLQRKKMKEFKQYLRKQNYDHKITNKKNEQVKDESQLEENPSLEMDIPPKLEFIPGLIVKLILSEPCLDIKKLKNDIKAISTDVKYVDIPATGSEVFVRFGSNDGVKEFCQNEFSGKRIVLESDEEKIYWNKIQNDRNIKFSKNLKKQRGRDKLLKKAEKERAKHIRFDEGD